MKRIGLMKWDLFMGFLSLYWKSLPYTIVISLLFLFVRWVMTQPYEFEKYSWLHFLVFSLVVYVFYLYKEINRIKAERIFTKLLITAEKQRLRRYKKLMNRDRRDAHRLARQCFGRRRRHKRYKRRR